MAGYSGTPLAKKLGVKEGFRLAFVSAPASFPADLGPLPPGAEVLEEHEPPIDLAIVFVDAMARLAQHFGPLASRLATAGMLWVAWPKKSSGVATDLNENIIRDFGLANGLVDVKICAIDETWSGLKFVYRLKDRPSRTATSK